MVRTPGARRSSALSRTGRTVRVIGLTLLAALVVACGSHEMPATEIVPVVHGDPEVIAAVKQVRASIYASDALTGAAPVQEYVFTLSTAEVPRAGEVRLPFSFGIGRGRFDRFKLVIRGYDSLAQTASMVVEQKVIVSFEADRSRGVDIYLSADCLHLTSPCHGLDKTCLPQARACTGVQMVAGVPIDLGEELSSVPAQAADAGSTTASACPPSNACTSREFPCVASSNGAYSCRGQLAEWPMPSSLPGSKARPDYDFIASPRVTFDKVTSLTWQRDILSTNPGCSGTSSLKGDVCTWDEAKVFCSQLDLDGKRWRLPTKIELESIVDEARAMPSIATEAFPNTPAEVYWTASPSVSTVDRPGVGPRVWTVEFTTGVTSLYDPSQFKRARCVSGSAAATTTPENRYRAEADGSITDTRTKLTWQSTTAGPVQTWEQAKALCLSQGGGFRLPLAKELLTLIDPARFSPAIDPKFNDTPQTFFWSATPFPQSGVAEIVDFSAGYLVNEDVFETVGQAVAVVGRPYVRCVR